MHGSWGDHHNWDPVLSALSESFRVLAYDRRGHGASERPVGQGGVFENADDLAGLIDELELAPGARGRQFVWRCGRFARCDAPPGGVPQPDRSRTAAIPARAGTELEPALAEVQRRIEAVVALLEGEDHEGAARLFVETIAFGPGAWDEQLTAEMRDVFIFNAPTWLAKCAIPTPSRWTWTPWRDSTDRPC